MFGESGRERERQGEKEERGRERKEGKGKRGGEQGERGTAGGLGGFSGQGWGSRSHPDISRPPRASWLECPETGGLWPPARPVATGAAF